MKAPKYLFVGLIIGMVIFTAGVSMALELKSPAFQDNSFIPLKYTCQKENVSPPLEWTDAPENTKSFVIVCNDPDAVEGDFVHWVVYNIPAQINNLREGLEKEGIPEGNIKQGLNDFGDIGYGGPCAPPGKTHRYTFTLYCLDSELNLKAGLTRKDILGAISGHIIEKIQLIALYKR